MKLHRIDEAGSDATHVDANATLLLVRCVLYLCSLYLMLIHLDHPHHSLQ